MISSNFGNLSPITSASQPRRLKPYFPHSRQAVEPFPGNFQKRYDKHIHNLSLKPNNKSFLRRISMPKTLRSLEVDSWKPGQNLALLKKLVKPYQKYIRNVQGSLKHPKIHKLLPFLVSLEVSLRQESLRTLLFHRYLKRLLFHFGREPLNNRTEFLMKYKARLSKSLLRIKSLENLSVTIVNQGVVPANVMLEIIDKSLNVNSLKKFVLGFVSTSSFQDSQKLREQKVNISTIFAKLTHLYSNNLAWYSSLISSGKLTDLPYLQLIFDPKEISWGWKNLLHFHHLPKLQKLHLNFTVFSPPSEMAFFKNLSLPPSLEDLKLTLKGFTLSQINEDSQFMKRLQEANRVKTFNLAVVENDANSASHTKFACLLIRQFKNLETLSFTNMNNFLSLKSVNAQTKPLDFESFWMAVSSSKETLQSLSVSVSEIAFPEGTYSLETRFPRLQKLELENGVPSMTEFGRFCEEIPNLATITLKGIKFQDVEELKKFLDNVKEIPKGRYFALYLDVSKIYYEFLVGCLKKYIEEVTVSGRLGLHLTGLQFDFPPDFGEILNLVVQKGIFEPFSLGDLFSVMGKNILMKKY